LKAIGAAIEMKSYLIESDEVAEVKDMNSPGGIVIETLSNIRTVASLTLERQQAREYDQALDREDPHPLRSNFIKGLATGLGQLLQMWSMSLMFWWGGWLMAEYGESFTYRGYVSRLLSVNTRWL
jgi:ABC-type bacteriocin/lantibiotic exporter with double-glycine peptidase domain